jgi:CHAT domain-containing protein
LDTGLLLGRLPRARDEAGAIVDAMGSGRVLVAASASERSVKEARLGDYRLVHFATHAIVDEVRPDRSAILLAPGDPAEDGLLQIREIVGLPLSNSIVILSACRSASGAIPEGEAVTGLAQAFFEAGARAVVGSFWPLRDDESDALVERFADHLGHGASLAEAMRLARGDLIARGAPAAAWAGLLVIGDGDLVPRPGGAGVRTFDPAFLWIIAPATALAGLLVILLWRRLRAAHA